MNCITKMQPVIDNDATGRMFRDALKVKGISIRQLARRSGLSAAYISDLCLGRRQWTQEKMQKLSEHLTK